MSSKSNLWENNQFGKKKILVAVCRWFVLLVQKLKKK